MIRRRLPSARAAALSACIAVGAPVAARSAAPAPPRPANAQKAPGIDTAGMDTTASPCTAFYQYANGTWLANARIPADLPEWSTGTELLVRNEEILHRILEDAAKSPGSGPEAATARLVGAFYASGMDEARIEKAGAGPLAPEMKRIEGIRSPADIMQTTAHLQRIGADAIFGFGPVPDFTDSSQTIAALAQGGLGLPNRDYYLSDAPAMKAVRDAYRAHVLRVFRLLGDPQPRAEAEAATVMAIETRLARASLAPVALRDPRANYHPTGLSELEKTAPGAPWDRFFQAAGVSAPGRIDVRQPGFVTEAAKMIGGDTPLADWKVYLRWHLVRGMTPYLSSAFVQESFSFSRQLTGQKQLSARWKRVQRLADAEVGQPLGKLYVAKVFPPAAKQSALALVTNLRAALRDRIQTLDWMGDATKQEALKKLDRLTVKIGYPDKWRDYSRLKLDPDAPFATNVIRAEEFNSDYEMAKIGKPTDRAEWGMTPQTINAYYNPLNNEIVFPAAILQPPFFDPKADDASNYGAIGAVIGHEMTHGFDDTGRQFDAAGNLRDWWTKADAANFAARGDAIAKQYGAFEIEPGVRVNGKLTEGEDIADVGGLKIAYLALQKALAAKPHPASIGGFTPDQRFFIAFGQIWREVASPEVLRLQVASDPHTPSKFRVVGAIADTPEFYKAFNCPAPPAAASAATPRTDAAPGSATPAAPAPAAVW